MVGESPCAAREETQKIESNHINLRARLKRWVRRTVCFAQMEQMRDLVLGLFSNWVAFGWLICEAINTFATSTT